MRECGALPKINIGLNGSSSDIRIRRQVDHHVVAVHGRTQRGEIFHVAPHDRKPRVSRVLLEMPLATRRKVVVNGDAPRTPDTPCSEQPIHEMCANETCAAHHEKSRPGYRIDPAVTR